MTLPTVTLLLDDGTGTFPFDISRYLMADEGTSFNRGRADWQGAVTAGQLSLTLNNSDGRFTPGSTSIASPSPIKVDQRIRLRETVNGVTYTRFTGYVKSWPTEWPATVGTIAMSTITVTDGQARAERRELRSVVEEEILADSPSLYYTMNEDTGAVSAADSSGNQAAVLTMAGSGASVTFGTGTGPTTSPSANVAIFAGGKYFSGGPNEPLGLFFATTATLVGILSLKRLVISAGIRIDHDVYIDATGHLKSDAFSFTTTAVVNDGLIHHLGMTYSTGSHVMSFYLDGVLAASGTTATDVTVGATLGYDQSARGVFVGSMSHVTCGVTDFAAYYAAATTGFAGESGTARITRLAGYAGLSLGSLATSLTNVPMSDFSSLSQWDGIQQVSGAEFGAAYINGSGTLDFHNRDKVRTKTTPDLTLTATSYVTPDVQPVVDDQQIINYFEATSSATGTNQVARDTTSESSHGRYGNSETYLVTTDGEALDRANWVVANFAEPTTRYGTLTINLFAMPASLASSVLAAIDLDCWLRVVLMASQNPTGTTADVVVQGFTETCTADSWFITCNVVLRSLYNALILDDTTYGVLDSSVARLGV